MALCLAGCSDITAEDTFVYVPPPPKAEPDPRIFQPSDVMGGTLRLGRSGDWGPLDPADTVAPYARNFARNYVRTLTVFRAAPRKLWNQNKPTEPLDLVVPDLAESLGAPADGGRTWTYRLRRGVRYETGEEVVAGDIKRGVERALGKQSATRAFPLLDGLIQTIETPDDRSIVFRLSRPAPSFDYLAQLPVTAPVPADYPENAVAGVPSTGPYRLVKQVAGRRFELARNREYDAATDPKSGRKALADTIQVEHNVSAADMDDRLRRGTLDMEIDGDGSGAVPGEVVGAPTPSGVTETVTVPTLAYTLINKGVDPLWNVNCRKAVILAADRAAYQLAYGPSSTTQPATSMLPPTVSAMPPTDVLALSRLPTGDVDGALKALTDCQAQNGFTVKIAYRSDRPEEAAVAAALVKSLARAKITLEPLPLPSAGYQTWLANPFFTKENSIGLIVADRVLPWPDGHDFLRPVVDVRAESREFLADLREVAEATPWLDREAASLDFYVRDSAWRQLDRIATSDALVIPGVWGQNTLHRPTRVANVFINEAFGLYDYAALGKRLG